MRILHTADLHLGHSLNGWDREDEHRAWFDRLADIVAEEEIDVVVIAGDIYDNTNPSGEIQTLFYKSLMAIKVRRPGLRVIISGGNHDPAKRLEAPAPFMKSHDMCVVGSVHRKTDLAVVDAACPLSFDLDRHLIPVTDAEGHVAVYVLAVPFLRASDLPGLSFGEQDVGSESPIVAAARRFFEELVAAAEARMTEQGHSNLPLLMIGHLHCAGGVESEGAERRIMIGGSHAIPPDVFPARISYVALGHLHRPQSLDGGRVRYCGSCFPLSASEIGYDHGVTILDVFEDGISHRHLSVPHPAPVVKLPRSGSGTGSLMIDNLDEALDSLLAEHPFNADTPMGLRPFVYLEMKASDAASVIMTDATGMVKKRGLRLAGIRVRRKVSGDSDEAAFGGEGLITKSLRETTPEAIFVSAFKRKHGFEPEDRHLAVFREALSGETD